MWQRWASGSCPSASVPQRQAHLKAKPKKRELCERNGLTSPTHSGCFLLQEQSWTVPLLLSPSSPPYICPGHGWSPESGGKTRGSLIASRPVGRWEKLELGPGSCGAESLAPIHRVGSRRAEDPWTCEPLSWVWEPQAPSPPSQILLVCRQIPRAPGEEKLALKKGRDPEASFSIK